MFGGPKLYFSCLTVQNMGICFWKGSFMSFFKSIVMSLFEVITCFVVKNFFSYLTVQKYVFRAWRSKNIYCKRWQYLVFKRQFYFQSVIFPLPVSVLILNRLRQFLLWAKNSIRFRVERIKKRIRLNRFRVKDV